MTREEIIATRMTDQLFAGRKGHGGTPGITKRVLSHKQLRNIIRSAYQTGWHDGKNAPRSERD